jgi:CheY-like chemotaxis protein
MNILLVEDDTDKAARVIELLNAQPSKPKISCKSSLNEGLLALLSERTTLNVVILDMSMPNFDIGDAEPTGGKPENLAGRDLLIQMKLRKIFIPTIVLTMYDTFEKDSEKKSLAELQDQLAQDFSPFYRGLVHYSTTQEGWQSALVQHIENIK